MRDGHAAEGAETHESLRMRAVGRVASSMLLRFSLAALSGLLLAFSFPKFDLAALAFVALTPLLVALVSARSWKEALLLGIVTGSIRWLINLPWVIIVMSRYGGLPLPTGIAIFVLMSLILGLYTGGFGIMVRMIRPRDSILWWAAIPLFWTAIEFGRTYLLTGFPWNLLAVAIVDLRAFVQLASVIGPYAVGFMIVFVSVLLAWLLVARRPAGMGFVVVGFLSVYIILWYALGAIMADLQQERISNEKMRTAALLQPNISQEMRWSARNMLEIFDRMIGMTEEAIDRGAEVVVWPESTVPLVYLDPDNSFYRDNVEALSSAGADIILGSVARGGEERLWNAAYLVSEGDTTGRYDKIRLVPFGEYVPLRRLLFFAETLVREVGDFQFGTSGKPLEGRFRYGPAICYEVVYPRLTAQQVSNGAEVLVTITNDAWFGTSAAPWQHLNNARMRAIESDRFLLRAATTGISAVVDPTGRVVEEIPLGRQGTIIAEFAPRSTVTAYVRYGDWFAIVCLVAALLVIIIRRKGLAT